MPPLHTAAAANEAAAAAAALAPPSTMPHHGLVTSQAQLSPIVDSPIAMDLTNELWLHANGHHVGAPDFDSPYQNIKEGIGEQIGGFRGKGDVRVLTRWMEIFFLWGLV